MTPLAVSTAPRPVRWRQLRPTTKIVVTAFMVVVLTICLEAGARLFWWRNHGIARITPEAIWRTTYVEMEDSGIDAVAPHHSDGSYNVLLLGGSVLSRFQGDIGERLRAKLEERIGPTVRVVNLSYPGRTSRESLMKYARLEDRRFDLVV